MAEHNVMYWIIAEGMADDGHERDGYLIQIDDKVLSGEAVVKLIQALLKLNHKNGEEGGWILLTGAWLKAAKEQPR